MAYTLDIGTARKSHDVVFEAVFQNQSADHGCTRGIALVGTYLDYVLGLSQFLIRRNSHFHIDRLCHSQSLGCLSIVSHCEIPRQFPAGLEPRQSKPTQVPQMLMRVYDRTNTLRTLRPRVHLATDRQHSRAKKKLSAIHSMSSIAKHRRVESSILNFHMPLSTSDHDSQANTIPFRVVNSRE